MNKIELFEKAFGFANDKIKSELQKTIMDECCEKVLESNIEGEDNMIHAARVAFITGNNIIEGMIKGCIQLDPDNTTVNVNYWGKSFKFDKSSISC